MGNSVVFSKSDNADIRRVVYVPKYDAEVEYLQSSGTQWFDSRVAVLNTTGIEIVAQKVVANNSDSFACGIRKDDRYFIVDVKHYNSNDNGILYVGFGKSLYNQISRVHLSQFKVAVNVNNSRKIVLNDHTTSWNLPSDISVDGNIYVFAANGLSNRWRGRIYYLKIYDNNTLVRDFIPVRVGQIGYMYDRVSGKLFGNSGTGNFVLGQDVAKPIVKRYVVPMPYDCRVEYLESTGTQYIDLDYICSTNTIASVTVLPTQSKTQQRFIGSSSAYFEIYQNNNGYYGFASNDNIHTTIVTFQSTTKVNLTTKRKLTINNVISRGIVDSIRTAISKNTKFGRLYLLTRPSYHPERAAVCRLYAASVIDGDFKMDLIPVRKNGIGYMYDRVSCRLFGNSGTGNFILGNDIN